MSNIQTFDFSVDLLSVLAWEYQPAEALQALLNAKSAWYAANHQAFWESWVTDVFDLRTCNAFGLAVWALILDVPLSVAVPPTTTGLPFGFGDYNQNFGNGTFWVNSAQPITLAEAQARLLLQLRYYQLTTRGTVTEINRMLKNIFGAQGLAYVLDGLDMTMTYVFRFQLDSQLLFVLEQYDILPRPCGVSIKIILPNEHYFGFGPANLNFNNGAFAPW